MGIETEYQQALYTRLVGAGLGVTGVYDTAPQAANSGDGAAFPYVVMGLIFAVESDTQSDRGFEITTRLHVFSRTGSKRECKLIQERVYDALHLSPLTMPSFSEYDLLRQDTDCTADQDGKIEGICTYRGLIERIT